MAVLVTNDDGIGSPGLHELALAVRRAGFDTVVAAPERDMSGAGASIGYLGQNTRIRRRPVALDGFDGPAFAVDGPPGLIVLLARLGGLGADIDAVASGINPGWNTGRSVLHSGTIGAALTGANGGWSGVAVSTGDRPRHWRTAAELGARALEWVLDAEPGGTVVNLNVPDVAPAGLQGVRWANLANPPAVRASITDVQDDWIEVDLLLNEHEVQEGTDTGLVRAGYAAVTLLRGVSEGPMRPLAEHLDAHAAAGAGT